MLAWRHVRALRDPEAWDPWLYRLTVRACYRLARSHRRRDLVELHVVPDLEPAIDIDISRAACRTRPARSRDRPAALRPASRDGDWALLSRPASDGGGEILDIPVGTAKSRLHRGLETLRKALADEPSEPQGGVVRERPA